MMSRVSPTHLETTMPTRLKQKGGRQNGGSVRLTTNAQRRACVTAPSLVAAVVTMAVLSGCSSNSKKITTTPASTAGSAKATAAGASSGSASPSSSAASPVAPSGVDGGDCGGAVQRVKAAVSSFKEVVGVQMIADCTEVDIVTSLAPGVLGSPSAETAVKICRAAAAVAYQGDVSSVTLDASDKSEAAIGIKGQDCIPG
jgi:hypothetical protein